MKWHSVFVFETKFWPEVKHIAPVVDYNREEQEHNHQAHDNHSKHPEDSELVYDTPNSIEAKGPPVKVNNDSREDGRVDLGAQYDQVVKEEALVDHVELQFR